MTTGLRFSHDTFSCYKPWSYILALHHRVLLGLQATLGIFYFTCWPYFMDQPMSRAAINKHLFLDILSHYLKPCLMRPMRGRNCHTQFNLVSTQHKDQSQQFSPLLKLITNFMHSLKKLWSEQLTQTTGWQ